MEYQHKNGHGKHGQVVNARGLHYLSAISGTINPGCEYQRQRGREYDSAHHAEFGDWH